MLSTGRSHSITYIVAQIRGRLELLVVAFRLQFVEYPPKGFMALNNRRHVEMRVGLSAMLSGQYKQPLALPTPPSLQRGLPLSLEPFYRF